MNGVPWIFSNCLPKVTNTAVSNVKSSIFLEPNKLQKRLVYSLFLRSNGLNDTPDWAICLPSSVGLNQLYKNIAALIPIKDLTKVRLLVKSLLYNQSTW